MRTKEIKGTKKISYCTTLPPMLHIIIVSSILISLIYIYASADEYYYKNELQVSKRNSYSNAQAREKLILPFHKDKVGRKKGELIIKNNDKVLKIFKNTGERDNVMYYSFIDINENNNCILIEIQYYEGGDYELLNYKTGQYININGIPIWSPSNNKFAVLNADLEAGYTPNSVAIWSISNGNFKNEWTLKNPQIGGDRAKWISNDEIKIRTVQSGGERYLYKILYCNYKNNKWTYLNNRPLSSEEKTKLSQFKPFNPDTTIYFEGDSLSIKTTFNDKTKHLPGIYSKGPWTQHKVNIAEFYVLYSLIKQIFRNESFWGWMIVRERRKGPLHSFSFSDVEQEMLNIVNFHKNILDNLNKVKYPTQAQGAAQITKNGLYGIYLWEASLIDYFKDKNYLNFKSKLSKQFRNKNTRVFDEFIEEWKDSDKAWYNFKKLKVKFSNKFTNPSPEINSALKKLFRENNLTLVPDL